MSTQGDLINIIRLINSTNISSISFFKLANSFSNIQDAIDHLENLIHNTNTNKKIKVASIEFAKQEIERARAYNIELITYQNPLYPPLLQKIHDKPPILYAKGNPNFLKKICLSIVGSRSASDNSLAITHQIAQEIGDKGICIISGLALGVDKIAHSSSLNTGTIAVLGNCINIPYPKQNQELYEKIINQGLLISEFPIDTKPAYYNFPKRNRIIAGIARATFVAEASIKSGSLSTAKYAFEYDRLVFTLEPIYNEPHKIDGNIYLKNKGATIIKNAHDIIKFIKSQTAKEEDDKQKIDYQIKISNIDISRVNIIKDQLMQDLDFSPKSINQLVIELKSNYIEIVNALILLDLEDEIIWYTKNLVSKKIKQEIE